MKKSTCLTLNRIVFGKISRKTILLKGKYCCKIATVVVVVVVLLFILTVNRNYELWIMNVSINYGRMWNNIFWQIQKQIQKHKNKWDERKIKILAKKKKENKEKHKIFSKFSLKCLVIQMQINLVSNFSRFSEFP